jgi:uncharacterized protein YndB with AHSA1/START domain
VPLERIRLVEVIPAPPATVYAAWVNGDKHAAMTGAPATSDAKVGGQYSAWDGYITGQHLELRPGTKVVQSWRTSEFGEDDQDSRLTVLFEDDADGTRLTLIHADLPDGTALKYEEGWEKHYFEPMKKHFSSSPR